MLVTRCAAFLMPQAASAIAVGAFLMGNGAGKQYRQQLRGAQHCFQGFAGSSRT